jgi:hypothetical protein
MPARRRVSGLVAPRVAALAGIAVLALAIAFAVARHGHHGSSLPPAVGPWRTALAAAYTPSVPNAKGACGIAIGAKTIGVAHPVLPCGVKIYIDYGDRHVLTQVIDRGPATPGREFNLTIALAKLLGLDGTQEIRWRFAS